MKNIELKEKLFDEFSTWFIPRFEQWQDSQFQKMEAEFENVCDAFLHSSNNADTKIKQFDTKWHAAKIVFLKENVLAYYDVILDQYNQKKIGKRALKVYIKEITESLEQLKTKVE